DSADITEGEWLAKTHVYDAIGGGNVSPHLRWSGFPAQTRSFAVTCFDPDAPTASGWWHWVLFDIAAGVTELPAGAGAGDKFGIHVRNDYGSRDYGGAAPPAGDPHRYIFVVHALDRDKLGPGPDATPATVGFHLTAHALGRATITTLFGT